MSEIAARPPVHIIQGPLPTNEDLMAILEDAFRPPVKPKSATPKNELERWHPNNLDAIWRVMAELSPEPELPRTEILRTLIGMCGLEQSEAAGYLKLAPQSLRQKLSGKRPILDEEIAQMVHVLRLIKLNRLTDMPEGARRVYLVTEWLKGR